LKLPPAPPCHSLIGGGAVVANSMRLTNTAKIYTAQKNVAVSGTPEQLDAALIPDGASVVVKAKTANTGTITVGNSSANALNSGTAHYKLTAGMAIGLQVKDASAIWLDATVSGEGVEVIAEY